MTHAPTSDRRELLKQALDAIEQLKAKVRSLESAAVEPIAIVGAGCRFPGGANDLERYWALLAGGKDVVSEIPASRWEALGHSGVESGWHAGLIDEIDRFDPRFFGISAREAATMDPQQRMVLEVAWEALENAGQAPDRLNGSRTGVFLGITGHDYADLVRDAGGLLDVYAATGNANNAAAGRLSFLLGLQGPSLAVDTACSSSLVAIHLACLSLKAGDCRMALAGGVNAVLTPGPFACFREWGMMSPDGHCKTFDARADGFVRGEGCGFIVLKRLSDAQADGDRVLALIRGSAVNQDGRSSGLTVPNGPAQETVIRQALAAARVDPLEVSYVEAHGTGTSLGDPIEAHALAAVLGPGRPADRPLTIGSVKTNIGHLESAAGVAGVLKVVLSLGHQRIPAHLHFQTMNPDIDWNGVPVEIPVTMKEWPRGTARRIAGVSSFGFSGTNAHLVLEEAPEVAAPAPGIERPLHLLTLSAQTDTALDELATRYIQQLAQSSDPAADVAFTANTGRAQLAERLAVLGATPAELADSLTKKRWVRGRARSGDVRPAFLFTGQGSQWVGMGRDLYQTQPVFRRALERCAAILDRRLERPLLEVIYGSDTKRLHETAYTQPALFAFEWALAQLWKSWGVEPHAMLGHSVGEYAALTVAGVWSLDDGLHLIAERGRLMQALGPGWGMSAVPGSGAAVRAALAGLERWVTVAAVNGPEAVVISGRIPELEEAGRRLEAAGLGPKRLTVSHGFHSPQMEGVDEEFARIVERIGVREPTVPVISSVTGRLLTGREFTDPSYWRRQIRSAVEFQAGMETLVAEGYDVFLEIGPTATLIGLGKDGVGRDGQLWVASLRKERDAWPTILDALSRLSVRGAEIDWKGFDAEYQRRRVALPTYPFQRQRYWIGSSTKSHRPPSTGHPLLGAGFTVAGPLEIRVWETTLDLTTFPYLADHRVQGNAVVPATAYMEMAMAAAQDIWGEGPVTATNLQFVKPIFLTPETAVRVQVSLDPGTGVFRIQGQAAGASSWHLHATGQVNRAESVAASTLPEYEKRATTTLDREAFYRLFWDRGNEWGPTFQGVNRAWLGKDEGWSRISHPEGIREEARRYLVHPALADAAGHILALAANPPGATETGAFVGRAIGQVTVYRRPRGTELLAWARVTPTADPAIRHGNVTVFDEDGQVVSELAGAELHYLDSEHQTPGVAADEGWFYRIGWREVPFDDEPAQPHRWAILADARHAEMAEALAARIRDTGDSAAVVLDPRSELKAVLTGDTDPTQVVSLLGLRARAFGKEMRAAATEITPLLELIREVATFGSARLWIVTRGAQPIEADSPADAIWQAPLWGIGRTVAVEHPEIYGGLVDLDPNGSTTDAVESLWRHLRVPGGQDQVALRGGRRLAARLERYQPPESKLPLRADGAYLVTGGLAGLGLEVARWLVQNGARRLVLASRSALPPRAQWTALAPDHPHAPQVAALRALEAAGAAVHPVTLDVAEPEAVADFVRQYRAEGWPPLRGVVHAAGMLNHHTLSELGPAELEDVLRPKLGAWLLHRELEAFPLDFFVMFSSASAILSSPKLGGYAAANAFLDAVAAYRVARGLPAISIDWGVWSEAGMAARVDARSVATLVGRGMGAMTTAQGLDALGRLLAVPDPQVAVLPVDWQRWGELYPAFTAAPFFEELFRHRTAAPAPASSDSGPAHAVLTAGEAQRLPRLREYLTTVVAGILGFAPNDLDDDLPINRLGLDSLTAVELKNRIAAELRVTLPTVRFLQGPSVAELAQEIAPHLERFQPDGKSAEPETADLLDRVDELSDAEVDAALLRLLDGRSAP